MADIRDIAEEFIAPEIEKQIVEQYNPHYLGWLQDRAWEIGQASERPLEYRAYVVPGEVINAFAIPGGSVFLYEGILQFDQPTVCGVLGHEIAHHAKRHVMDSVIAALGIDFLTKLFNQGRGSELADLVLQILWRGYGREREFEADLASIHYNQGADLWPYGIKYFLEYLASVEQAPTDIIAELLATHPPATERLAKVEAELARLGITEKSVMVEKMKSFLPLLLTLLIGGGATGALIWWITRKRS